MNEIANLFEKKETKSPKNENIDNAKKFADNNSTISHLQPKKFNEYNKIGLLQNKLPKTFHEINTTKENTQSDLALEKLMISDIKEMTTQDIKIYLESLNYIIENESNGSKKREAMREAEKLTDELETRKKVLLNDL